MLTYKYLAQGLWVVSRGSDASLLEILANAPKLANPHPTNIDNMCGRANSSGHIWPRKF
jgi:hypothetical protein